jgi:hypothetical protein
LAAFAVLASSATTLFAEPFTMSVGDSVAVDGTDVFLTFVAVPRDSRCPRDVECIVAGEAIVVFEVQRGVQREELTFEVPPGGTDEETFEGLTIHILALEPETDSTRKIEPSDYVATVEVTLS